MEQKAQHEGERYLREVRRKILFLPRKSRKMLKELTSDVETYIADNPDCTYAALVETYGAPDQIPYDSIEKDGFNHILRRMFHSRCAQCVCTLLLLSALAFSLALIISIHHDEENYVEYKMNPKTGEVNVIIEKGEIKK